MASVFIKKGAFNLLSRKNVPINNNNKIIFVGKKKINKEKKIFFP